MCDIEALLYSVNKTKNNSNKTKKKFTKSNERIRCLLLCLVFFCLSFACFMSHKYRTKSGFIPLLCNEIKNTAFLFYCWIRRISYILFRLQSRHFTSHCLIIQARTVYAWHGTHTPIYFRPISSQIRPNFTFFNAIVEREGKNTFFLSLKSIPIVKEKAKSMRRRDNLLLNIISTIDSLSTKGRTEWRMCMCTPFLAHPVYTRGCRTDKEKVV